LLSDLHDHDLEVDQDHLRAGVERALARRYGERMELTDELVENVARLEGLFGDWQRATSIKFAALTLHRAATGVDPLAAEIWVPRLLGCHHGSRSGFVRTLRLLWRARRRGRFLGELAEEDLALLCEDLAWGSAGAAPTPSHGARRCEGRSRAPQGSAGGARVGSGGSRRGGSDRGDDSGGGGSDGSGGGSSGSGGSRWRINWTVVCGVCSVLTLLVTAAIYFAPPPSTPPAVTVAPRMIVKEVQAPPPKVIVITPGDVRHRPDATEHGSAEAP
jgi:hypothetical protein